MSVLATRNGGGCLPRLRTFMLLAAAMLPPLGQAQNANVSVPLMLAPDSERQGFVRIINKTNQSGMVRIVAFDDGGTAANPIEIQLAANKSFHFNSDDLADGNAAKGIGSIGRPHQGHWRLSVETALQDVRVLAFVRTRAGFLTAMHDVLPRDAQGRIVAEIINPGSNATLASSLRLVNAGANSERVSIAGVDDQGANAGPVTLTLGAGQSRTISAFDLENGAQGLTGRLGNGAGKWRLLVTAGQSVVGMSLLETQIGPMTNLSTTGVAAAAMTPTQPADDHGDSFANATSLAVDGRQSGRINPAGESDYFRVRVSESGTLSVYTTGDLDTRGYLYDSNERQLASNDDGGLGDGSNFRIQREVDAGTYYVRVEAYFRDATGAYGIHAEFEASTEPPDTSGPYGAYALGDPIFRCWDSSWSCRGTLGATVNEIVHGSNQMYNYSHDIHNPPGDQFGSDTQAEADRLALDYCNRLPASDIGNSADEYAGGPNNCSIVGRYGRGQCLAYANDVVRTRETGPNEYQYGYVHYWAIVNGDFQAGREKANELHTRCEAESRALHYEGSVTYCNSSSFCLD